MWPGENRAIFCLSALRREPRYRDRRQAARRRIAAWRNPHDRSRCERHASRHARHTAIREVRGMGLMLGTDLNSVETAKAVVAQLLQQGILINCTNETVLRFLPPYIIQKKHVDEVIRALDAALTRVPQHKSTLERFPKRSRTH